MFSSSNKSNCFPSNLSSYDVISSCSPRSDWSNLNPTWIPVAMGTTGLAFDTVCGSSRWTPLDSMGYFLTLFRGQSRDATWSSWIQYFIHFPSILLFSCGIELSTPVNSCQRRVNALSTCIFQKSLGKWQGNWFCQRFWEISLWSICIIYIDMACAHVWLAPWYPL